MTTYPETERRAEGPGAMDAAGAASPSEEVGSFQCSVFSEAQRAVRHAAAIVRRCDRRLKEMIELSAKRQAALNKYSDPAMRNVEFRKLDRRHRAKTSRFRALQSAEDQLPRPLLRASLVLNQETFPSGGAAGAESRNPASDGLSYQGVLTQAATTPGPDGDFKKLLGLVAEEMGDSRQELCTAKDLWRLARSANLPKPRIEHYVGRVFLVEACEMTIHAAARHRFRMYMVTKSPIAGGAR